MIRPIVVMIQSVIVVIIERGVVVDFVVVILTIVVCGDQIDLVDHGRLERIGRRGHRRWPTVMLSIVHIVWLLILCSRLVCIPGRGGINCAISIIELVQSV